MVTAVSVCVPTWLEDVNQNYRKDPDCCRMLALHAQGVKLAEPYSITDGLIRYKGRVWLGNDVDSQQKVLRE